MTREEAKQEQINDIMDLFEFRKVAEYMKSVDWKWLMGEAAHVPDEYELRVRARELLNKAEVGGLSTGGFLITMAEGEDYKGKWLSLNLAFAIEQTMLDGASYE